MPDEKNDDEGEGRLIRANGDVASLSCSIPATADDGKEGEGEERLGYERVRNKKERMGS